MSAASFSSATAAVTAPTTHKWVPFEVHMASRSHNKVYPERQHVPNDRVPWDVEWSEYAPKDFTHERAAKNSKDPSDPSQIKDLASRASYSCSPLKLDPQTSRPLNPFGRTGLAGRGRLFNWGPNHAADPIVTRPAQSAPGELEVVVIQRGDTHAWAFPGGMVDPGEMPQATLKREFEEEAMNVPKEARAQAKAVAAKVFAKENGTLVYAGYIDDPRNTDNAWLESYCMHHHIDSNLAAELAPLLNAGDDARDVKWLLARPGEPDYEALYGSHRAILARAVEQFKQRNGK